MEKKVVPSLFHLYNQNKLPTRFKIVGFSKQDLSDESFSEVVFSALIKNENTHLKTCGAFCDFFSYYQGHFEKKKDYFKLAKKLKEIDDSWGICTNKLFYFAVPPKYYNIIFKNLAESGLTIPCSPKEGWSRILVEKPFGKDLATAEYLDRLLSKYFKEIQIYRIDHYLAKEMLQNILSFRFSNNLFEKNWDSTLIDKIEIRLHEKIGVEKRGNFYDHVGAFSDVGQNHMLQMLALVTMDNPLSFKADAIRRERAKTLSSLDIPTKDELKNFVFRSQYEGYQGIAGVRKNSKTETYFKVRAFLNTKKFQEVPIILESGKRLKDQIKEIEITFKHETPCLCPPEKEHFINKMIIALEPEEAIKIQFWSKKPGHEFEMEKRNFEFLLRGDKEIFQYMEEYSKLILDAIAGDQTLFISSEEMRAMWRFTDPIVAAFKKNVTPLYQYEPDTDQPIAQSAFINEGGHQLKIPLKRQIGMVGLGKMGLNLSKRLQSRGWKVIGYDEKSQQESQEKLFERASSLKELTEKIYPKRIIWLMLPAGKAIDTVIGELGKYLKKGDVIIDGGNSFYRDSVRRYRKLQKQGIHFIDVGVSGGPEGALLGSSLMIGGNKEVFLGLEPLFYDLSKRRSYQFFEGAGAGHFVKMIHNGIEYGMMQSIAEGFSILKKSTYNLDLTKVSEIYNNGGVIESRLMRWLEKALQIHGKEFKGVSGSVAHTGGGEWTVKTAKELGLAAKIIEESFKFRVMSKKNPSYEGKILSALREQFGGHTPK